MGFLILQQSDTQSRLFSFWAPLVVFYAKTLSCFNISTLSGKQNMFCSFLTVYDPVE